MRQRLESVSGVVRVGRGLDATKSPARAHKLATVPTSIRPARLDDAARIEQIENAADALLVELLRPETWHPAPPGRSRLEEPGFVLIVTDAADHAIGFVHVLEADGLAHLEQVSVDPAHARRGYGRALVEAAKAEARARGYERLTLRTFAKVPWNAPFYATCGFVETSPTTEFQLALAAHEDELGLTALGRRVQMTAKL
ncbi:GNAT family N-acetyltransferase [Microbacterium sp.]|uniref:GNAT family N-acetyltransferase n=1 Tax=Microbacterium sp. TaxID=51671 RepID=UPI0039E2CC70